MNPGHHLGILPNGSMKPPRETGRGEHGQFYMKILTPSPHLRLIAGRDDVSVRKIMREGGREGGREEICNRGLYSSWTVELRIFQCIAHLHVYSHLPH